MCAGRRDRAGGSRDVRSSSTPWISIAALVCAAGCGRLDYRPGEVVDAGASSDAGTDAPTTAPADAGDAAAPRGDAGPCAVWRPFSTPIALGELNTPENEQSPDISSDGLEILFQHELAPSEFELRIARRLDTASSFDAPTRIIELDAAGLSETDPALSRDGLEVVFVRDADVFVARRPSRSAAFGVPEAASYLSFGGLDLFDDLTLFHAYSSGGQYELVIAARADRTAPFVSVREIDELNTAASERSPGLSPDGLEIFVTATRLGRDLIYSARRASLAATFGALVVVGELDLGGTSSSRDPDLSGDGRTIYFASDGPTGGSDDLWYATRECDR
jgi:hypothetical protein